MYSYTHTQKVDIQRNKIERTIDSHSSILLTYQVECERREWRLKVLHVYMAILIN